MMMKIIAHILLINFYLFSHGRQEELNKNELDPPPQHTLMTAPLLNMAQYSSVSKNRFSVCVCVS